MVNKRIPCKCRMAERAKPNVFYFCCKWLGAQDTCRDHVARSTHKCESPSFKPAAGTATMTSRESAPSMSARAPTTSIDARYIPSPLTTARYARSPIARCAAINKVNISSGDAATSNTCVAVCTTCASITGATGALTASTADDCGRHGPVLMLASANARPTELSETCVTIASERSGDRDPLASAIGRATRNCDKATPLCARSRRSAMVAGTSLTIAVNPSEVSSASAFADDVSAATLPVWAAYAPPPTTTSAIASASACEASERVWGTKVDKDRAGGTARITLTARTTDD